MASLKIIRKRITSVKNTQKITKAMKMVAAAKLRRAHQAVVAARPYADGIRDVIVSIATSSEMTHPLLAPVENPSKAEVLVFTSNRGLCGGFNSNLLRRTEPFFKTDLAHLTDVAIKVIGKKGRDFYRARHRSVADVFVELAESFPFERAMEMAGDMIARFLAGDLHEVYIVYNKFKSALSQEVTIEKILPLNGLVEGREIKQAEGSDFIYEPSKSEIIDLLVPKYLASQLYRAHLESLASELGSRMTAMENATKNAREMIGSLTLEYNRARQAAITRELMDIVNGSESIK